MHLRDSKQRREDRQRSLPNAGDRNRQELARSERGRADGAAGEGPTAEGQGRRQGRRRFGRGGKSNEAGQERRDSPISMPPSEAPLCPLCSKPVFDLSSAIGADRESGLPAHFDCVYDRVKAAESLGPNEKVVYLGAGSFAVVEFKDAKEGSFAVKRRIQWEKEGDKKEWRKSIYSRYSGS